MYPRVWPWQPHLFSSIFPQYQQQLQNYNGFTILCCTPNIALWQRWEFIIIINGIPGSLSPNASSTSEFAKDGSSYVCGNKP